MDSLQELATTSAKLDNESELSPTLNKSATAFTIEFDDMNNNLLKNANQKKNFERGNSLRDSLKKYAPQKLEKLTKLKSKDDNFKNVDTKSNLNYSVENHSDRNLSDGASFLIQKMFNCNSTSKQSTTKLANRTNQPDIRLSSSSCKSTPLKLRNFNNINNNVNGILNYNCNSTSKQQSNGLSSKIFKSQLPIEMDSGVCCADEDDNRKYVKEEKLNDEDEDAISETGTYTVELDNEDPIAEKARKRINEIFGVKEEKNKQQLDSMSNSSSSNSSKPNSKHSFKISSIKNVYQDTCDINNRTRHNSVRSSSAVPLKNKPHDSFNNNEFQRKNSFPFRYGNDLSSLQRQQPSSSLKRQDSFGKSSAGKLSTLNDSKPPLSSSNNKKSQLNQNINLINQNNTFVFNCASNNKDSSNTLLNRAKANSINNKSLTKKFTRKDQLRDDDTVSIKSEDASTVGSTDLSSMNSEKCKSDTGQTNSSLRFNRAFALRRARLGIDTPPLMNSNNNNKNATKNKSSNSNKPNSQLSHIPLTSVNHHQSRKMDFGFDRSDGGRYSLRASSSSSKPPINSQNRLAIASKSKQPMNHQLQQTNSSNSLNRHETSSLISAISISKNKVANKMTKKNSFIIEDTDHPKLNHVRANSFGGGRQLNNLTNNNQAKPRLSSAASTSSNNTMSNASTSEDLSNISDQMKSIQHLSPFSIGRRIYSTKPHYIAQTNSFRYKLEENNLFQNGSNNELMFFDQQPHSLLTNESPQLLALTESRKQFGQLSNSSTPQSPNSSNFNNSNGKSLSALDYLVLSAVHQLSFKLRCKLRSILDNEKSKYSIDNENRILIEELLPQVNVTEYRNSETSEKTISRDLSNVLKNLKRIEQSLEVINLLLESNSLMKSEDNSTTDELICNNKDVLLGRNNDTFSLEI